MPSEGLLKSVHEGRCDCWQDVVVDDHCAALRDAIRDEATTLRRELEEARGMLARLTSEEPCPACGSGVRAACYGCEIAALTAERDALRGALKEIASWEVPTSECSAMVNWITGAVVVVGKALGAGR